MYVVGGWAGGVHVSRHLVHTSGGVRGQLMRTGFAHLEVGMNGSIKRAHFRAYACVCVRARVCVCAPMHTALHARGRPGTASPPY